MKTTKRILGLLLSFLLLFSVCPYAEPAADSEQPGEWDEAIAIIRALGVMNGDQSGDFLPNDSLTRAEMSVIAVNIIFSGNPPQNLSAGTPFQDVPETHFAASYISAAEKMGLMKGYDETHFGPDDKLSYEQAVKVVVSLLGYDIYAQREGGYPAGYYSQANQLGLLKKIRMTQGRTSEIPRGDTALLLYNALNVPILKQISFSAESVTYTKDQNKTLLTEYFKAYLVRGMVIANDFSSVDGKETASKGRVILYDRQRKVSVSVRAEDTDIAENLGRGVSALVKDKEASESGEYELLYYRLDDSYYKTMTLEASQIEDVSADSYRIEYTGTAGDDETSYVSFSKAISLVINGVYTDFVSEEQLKISNGTVTLIDTEGSGTYSLALIDSYYNIVVKNVSRSDGMIVDYYDSNKRVKLDFDDSSKLITLIHKDGTEATMFDISPFSVVSVFESVETGGLTKIKAMVSNDTLEDGVDEFSGEGYVTVSGTRYPVDETYLNENGGAGVLSKGGKLTLCLDFKGQVCGVQNGNPMDFASDYSQTMNYAYLLGVNMEGTLENPKFKILTLDSKLAVFEGDDNLRFNGEKISAEQMIESLQATCDGYSGLSQLIKFRTSADGRVKEINTGITGTDYTELRDSDQLYQDAVVPNATLYKVVGKGEYALNNNSAAFLLPADVEDEESMKAVAAVSLDLKNVDIQVYDLTSRKVAGCIVTKGSVSPRYENDDPTYAVEKLVQAVTEDGDIQTKVYLFKKDGARESYWFLKNAKLCEYDNYYEYQVDKGEVTFNKPEDLKSGDVVRIAVDEKGTTLTGVQRLFSVQAFRDKDNPAVGESYTHPFNWEASEGGADYSHAYDYLLRWVTGYAADKDDEFIRLKLPQMLGSTDWKEQFYVLRPTNAFSSFIVMNEQSDGTFKMSIGSADDIRTSSMNGEGNESLVFFKSRYAVCHEIYIYNFKK